jgi:hypothetical protein
MVIRRAQVERELEILGAYFRPTHFCDGPDRSMRIHRLKLQLQFVRADSREIEQVVDEFAFQLNVPLHHRQSRFDFTR